MFPLDENSAVCGFEVCIEAVAIVLLVVVAVVVGVALLLHSSCCFDVCGHCSICFFSQAFINEKHLVATVKEKEEAHREYKQAIEKGHGAYLLDEGE